MTSASKIATQTIDTLKIEATVEFDNKRTLYLSGNINAKSSMELISQISDLYSADPQLPITLFIVSNGGNVSDAFAVYGFVMNVLNTVKPNLQTVILGEASSMAILLFMMADKRFIDKFAIMKFHKFSYTVEREMSLTTRSTEKIILDLQRSEQLYIDAILERCCNKIAREELADLMENEVSVTSEQAVIFGLAHHIL